MKLDLAQFRALESFAAFASDLDEVSRKQLARGERLVEILKQPEARPLPVEAQLAVIFFATGGFVDDVPVSRVQKFEKEFLTFLNNKHSSFPETLKKEKKITPEIRAELKTFLEEFKTIFKEQDE